MRTLFLLLTITILVQSCYSYKELRNNSYQYETVKHYKVHHEKIRTVVNIKSITDSILFVITNRLEKKSISLDSITKVKKRKFSIWKTLLFPMTYIGLLATTL